MNFLAPLHLADISNTSLPGHLAAQFIKGDIDAQPKPYRQGMWLGQQIHQLSAEHELTQELRAQFAKALGPISTTLIALAFDHMLARCWEEYHSQPLAAFCPKAYQQLAAATELPQPLPQLLPRMQRDNWLQALSSRNGLNAMLQQAARLSTTPQLFKGTDKVLQQLDREIEISFRTLYPQLMAYSRILARKTPEPYLP
ncbi:ACP phosphodiesterase [Shewanella sp. YIC-542]|uniref:ACP phosphodiesterase n=1 Tax=Shewanella mytili TaxID=3377111 RepID=UPI00398E3F11